MATECWEQVLPGTTQSGLQGLGADHLNLDSSNIFSSPINERNASLTLPSQFDGVVVPPQDNAQLPGATVVSVQSLCPLRPDTHVTMTISAASYALALDALNNKGIASLARVRKSIFSTCLRVTAKGMNPDLPTNIKELLENLVKGFL